ncbi:MAG: XkdF-like putative serine protease domain-containing protein [Clostridiales bacterium]|nr:XkdF-like putative serine protease domain-containing protein [Clostridiales bacterium]
MKKFSDLIKSRADPTGETRRFQIQKVDEEKQLVFGWANVSVTVDGKQVVDLQEDVIEPEELETAAYKFAEFYRNGGEMHERGGCAVMVESVVLTEEKQRAMGIPSGTLPVGWWIGFHVTDDDVWEKVKTGEYSMFSIGGTAIREEAEGPSDA